MDFEHIEASDLLRWAINTYGDKFALVTSFQAEGMVLLDMAHQISNDVRVITVDTGRLPAATHEMIERVRTHYGLRVEIAMPDPDEVEAMTWHHGPNLFYTDVPHRMLCCDVRKVRPLERKLARVKAWSVGVRRSQTEARRNVQRVEKVDHRLKLAPLADWSRQQVEDYLKQHDVPRHNLYAQGYTSIGCAPCTRQIDSGEGERAGRWWWEGEGAAKECGIHFSANGKMQRTVDVLLQEILEAKVA